MTDEPTLKACPCHWCDDPNPFVTTVLLHRVECLRCNARGPIKHEIHEAIAAWNSPPWNTRADEPRFRVGDRVKNKTTGEIADVKDVLIEYGVLTFEPEYERWGQNTVEPAPAPLPEDHISRLWQERAIIHGANYDADLLVISGKAAVGYPIHRGGGVHLREDFDSDTDTGWSFHPDSPIQTPKEP